jgi:hypothetical protein
VTATAAETISSSRVAGRSTAQIAELAPDETMKREPA